MDGLSWRVWGAFVVLELQLTSYDYHMKKTNRHDERTLEGTQEYTSAADTVLKQALALFNEEEAQELLDYPIEDLAPSLQAPKEGLEEATEKLKLARWGANVTIMTIRKLHAICVSLKPEGPEKWVKE